MSKNNQVQGNAKPADTKKSTTRINRADLVAEIVAKTGLSKATASKALAAFLEAITSEMEKKQKVALLGFGSFSVQRSAARKGRNPRTGKTIDIPATEIVKFKPGKWLKEATNQN